MATGTIYCSDPVTVWGKKITDLVKLVGKAIKEYKQAIKEKGSKIDNDDYL